MHDLNQAIKFCEFHHFADDTNLLCPSSSIKKLKKIFKSKQRRFEGDLKVRLCGKRLSPTESVKYLGVKIDANFNWQC